MADIDEDAWTPSETTGCLPAMLLFAVLTVVVVVIWWEMR